MPAAGSPTKKTSTLTLAEVSAHVSSPRAGAPANARLTALAPAQVLSLFKSNAPVLQFAASDSSVSGFDVDYLRLLFSSPSSLFQVPLQLFVYSDEWTMIQALRNGTCDAALSAMPMRVTNPASRFPAL